MGQLVSSAIPNLISGVSQQPWNVRLPTQAEEQINCSSSVTDFLTRRPATAHLARVMDQPPENGVAAHGIQRDETERYIVLATQTGIQVHGLDGTPKTVTLTGSGPAYLAAAQDPDRDLRFLTINDYTFVLNRRVTVQSAGALSPRRPPEAIVFIKQASYNTTYTVTMDGRACSFTTLDGVAPADQPADSLSSREIADNLAGQIRALGYVVDSSHSTLWIRRADGGDFRVKVEDSRSNTHTSLCKGKVQRFSDLPTVAPTGFVTEILGDSSSSFDNYYCAFEPADAGEAFGTGAWRETVKPGVAQALDPATMPHALIRQADGTFTFGPLEWGERTCGDDESAPMPSFVGRTLGGLFFYRNRLAVLSGENVIMSEVGEFFNFFCTTVTTLVDSDVIDVAASSTTSGILEHAAVFSGGLLLFSEQAQYVLEHDTTLSNATVSVKPVTEFEASMRAAPVSSGKTVFFATDQGAYGGVREYFTMPDASDQNDAADVTAHVPRYIGGGIRKLACSTNEDLLLALSAQRPRSLWVYKYFWNGSEKIQSAWCRWDMAGDVLSLIWHNTDLYLVMRYPDGVCLEKMTFAAGYKDDGADFEYCLDRKVTENQVSPAYDPDSKTTVLTLPYAMDPANPPLIVTRPGDPGAPGGLLAALRVEGRTLTLKGDLRGRRFFAGLPYLSSYTFSPFALRGDNGKGNAVTSGRLQVRRLTLNCSATGYLQLSVTPSFRPTSTYTFTGREMGHGANRIGAIPLYTGTVKCPVLSLNTQVKISVSSDSFLPFALVSAEWEGFYNTRSHSL